MTEDSMQQRLDILDAICRVMEHRREFVEVVGAAGDADAAQRALVEKFGFSDVQAIAVLDLQVRRFAQDERVRISNEADRIRIDLGRQ